MRPTKYLREWSGRDRGLAEGLLIYEGGLNPVGLPPHIARDKDRRFNVEEVIDQAMATLEETQAEYRVGDAKPTPGLRLVVVDNGPIVRTEPPGT